LLRPDERPARRAVAEARMATTRAQVALEEWRVAAEVRRARIKVFATEQATRLLEQELALRDEAVTLVRRQKDLGEATDLNVLLIELDRTGVQRKLRDSTAALERERLALNEIVGVPPTYELPLTDLGKPLEFLIFDDLSEDEVDRRLLAARFDLRASASSYQQAEQELRLAIARQFPGVRLGPSFEKDVEGSKGLGIGGSFEIPLFDRNQGEIALKVAARERARAEYAALLHELRARAFEARASLERAREEVEVEQRDVAPLIERTEALFEGALRARELTVFEWITARGRALEARGNLLDALVRYTSAVVDLESATGMPLGSSATQRNMEKEPNQ
jgi:outer membrane protein TolC